MNDQNPYAAPQTSLEIPAALPMAEESLAQAHNYSSFCWAVGFLLAIWCLVPVGVVAARNVRGSEARAGLLLLLMLFFAASWWLLTVPHKGWILRWFQVSVGLQAITLVLLGVLLLGELQSGLLGALGFTSLMLSLSALLAGIVCLGRELFSPSLVKPACCGIGVLGLATLFFILCEYTFHISARDAHDAFLVLLGLSLLVGYVAILISLGFAWRMPRVISERMQRCFPTRIVPENTPASQFLQSLQQQDADQGSPAELRD